MQVVAASVRGLGVRRVEVQGRFALLGHRKLVHQLEHPPALKFEAFKLLALD